MGQEILIIDDDARQLQPLANDLRRGGYLPTLLTEAERPIDQFTKHEFELVFINLACSTAKSLCDGIRTFPEGVITPVIFVGSGSDSIRNPADALNAGGDYYFRAPVDATKALAKVQTYLGPGTAPAMSQLATEGPAKTLLAGASDALLAQIAAQEQTDENSYRPSARSSPPVSAPASPSTHSVLTEADDLLAVVAAQHRQDRDQAEQRKLQRAEDKERRQREQAQREQEEATLAAQHEREQRARAEAAQQQQAWEAEQATQREVQKQREAQEATLAAEREAEEQAQREVQKQRAEKNAAREARAQAVAQAASKRAEEDAADRTARKARRIAPRPPSDSLVKRAPGNAPPREFAVNETATAAHASTPLHPLSPEEGILSAQFDVAQLLAEVIKTGVTGCLKLIHGTQQRCLYFEDGAPVDAKSNQTFDRVEEYLLRESKITRAQYQQVRVKQLPSARQASAFLLGAGFLKPQELFEAVRGHLREQFYEFLSFEQGSFHYLPEAAAEADCIYLDDDPRALLLEGVRRKYLLPRLVSKIGAPSTLLALLPEGLNDVLQSLRLSASEAAVVRRIDGQHNIEDVIFSSGLEASRVYAVLFALSLFDGIQILVRGIDGSSENVSPDPIDRQRILEKLEHGRLLDYFAILGIARQATPYEIEHAWQNLNDAFRSDHFSSALQQELREELQEIVEILAEAKWVLGDADRRLAYTRNLP